MNWTALVGSLVLYTYRTHFRPTSLYIVTWYRVGAFSRSRSPVCFMFIVYIKKFWNFAFVGQPQYSHVLTVVGMSVAQKTQDVKPSAEDF